MSDVKSEIEEIISHIGDGVLSPYKVWDLIKELKNEYVEQYSEQSWHVYIGNKFQNVVHALIKSRLKELKNRDAGFDGFEILTGDDAKKNSVIKRKISIEYGDFLLIPDVDSAIVWLDNKQPWESEVLAIISCKTSLRERIAQTCYWKLKLLSSDITKGIRLFLATTDNDNDFAIKSGTSRYEGMTRNRLIAEYELNGVYILREDFKKDWESDKVKRFDQIFNDIIEIIKESTTLQ